MRDVTCCQECEGVCRNVTAALPDGVASAELGILLANLGGPGTLAEVEPFIRAIFGDPDVVPYPPALSKPLGWVIAKARAPKVRGYYKQIGGGSRILPYTVAQAEGLTRSLAASGRPAAVAVAMRATRPSTDDAVRRLLDAGVQRLVLLPLFPQYSSATTGSSWNEARRVVARLAPGMPLALIRSYHDHPAYLDALASRVQASLDTLPAPERADVVVIFSAHGLPQKTVDAGDPYVAHTEATVAGVLDRVRLPDGSRPRHRLAYQSRSGPVRWIEPGTDDVMAELAAGGCRSLLLVPVSFVSDHIETSFELDILFRDKARALGFTTFLRAATFNDDPDFPAALARVLLDWEGAKADAGA